MGVVTPQNVTYRDVTPPPPPRGHLQRLLPHGWHLWGTVTSRVSPMGGCHLSQMSLMGFVAPQICRGFQPTFVSYEDCHPP